MARVLNFSGGPAALPLPALERARAELLDFAGTGMSVMEQSHRGKAYDAVHEEALALVREVAALPTTHDVLFLQGGASMQFAQVPLAFLKPGSSADYVVQGVWGEKALGEAEVVGKLVGARVRVAATTGVSTDGTDGTGGKRGKGGKVNYTRAPWPAEVPIDPSAAYVHVTSNETIHGIQFEGAPGGPAMPETGGVPLVCDMSSDFLWRPIDFSRFAFVYAGAQKNVGPSGLVLVIAAKDFIAHGRKDIPKIFRYDIAAENKSLYNTPATFSIYLLRNVLSWLKSEGGLATFEARNREKARLVYAAIDDAGPVYRCPVEKPSRSMMNAVFRLPTEELDAAFVAEAKERGMVGLKGHRSVGGIRASLYNAVDLPAVQTLVEFMADFAKRHG